jgi:hypothetical protein
MRSQLFIAVLAASACAQSVLAQQAPRDPTSPAGSGGSSNAALINAAPEGPVPRLADGTPDFSGVWVGSGPIGDISSGLLPGEELVLLPAAKAVKDARMAADDPEALCLPTGVPRIAPYPWRIVQTPAFGKATHLFFLFEGNIHSFRQIFMDGREHPDDLEATWYGHSVGHWEGDTLVIETTSLKQYPYMTRQATSSDAHVVERMRVEERDVDGQKTKFVVNELVLTDPKVYTTPIKITGTLRHRPDLQLLEYTCTDALWDEYLTERGLTLPDMDALPDPEPQP